MQIKYGNYTHPIGEDVLTISREPLLTDAGTIWAVRERWDIQGILANPTGNPGDMIPKINALEQAYSVDGLNLSLLLPDGSLSAHFINSVATIGGTRISQSVQYPVGQGAEHVTFRTFVVSVEADRAVPSDTGLLSFTETLSFSGGGPKFGFLQPRTGRPIKQLLTKNTSFKATQQGSSVGLYGFPAMPAPIWPAALLVTPDATRTSPVRRGTAFTEYPISWNYQFEHAFPLVGNPHLWTQ